MQSIESLKREVHVAGKGIGMDRRLHLTTQCEVPGAFALTPASWTILL